MNKILFVIAFTVVGFTTNAQSTKFGVTAGYLDEQTILKANGETEHNSESGFYAGILLDIKVSNKFYLQPEILYGQVVKDGGAIFAPVICKIYMDNNASFQVGPQFVFATEEIPDEIADIEYDLIGGLAFDFSEHIFIEGRYTYQLNNSYTGDLDLKVRANYLTIGLGYKF